MQNPFMALFSVTVIATEELRGRGEIGLADDLLAAAQECLSAYREQNPDFKFGGSTVEAELESALAQAQWNTFKGAGGRPNG